MSRQDANAAFALSSFLQGTNATYIDDLYARYEKDPTSVDADWQAFFKSLKDAPADVAEERRRAVLGARQLAADAARRPDLRARRQLGAGRKGRRRQARRQGAGAAQGQRQGQRADGGRHPPGHARFGPRPDADPRLPHARPFPRQARSARDRSRQRDREELDPRSYGFTEADFDRKIFLDHVLGLEYGDAARDRRDLRAHLLPDARRRVHAHLQRARRRPGSRSASRGRTRKSVSPARAGARS